MQRLSKNKIWNLPNILTLLRVFLVPIVIVFLTLRTQFGNFCGFHVGDLIAVSIFAIASLTDAIDGYLARKNNQITNFGKFLDPLADKILVIAVLITMVELGLFPSIPVVIIITREFIVSGLRMVAASEGVVIAASRGGKLKTITQLIGIIMLMLELPFAMTVMWISVILTVWSGIEYLINGLDVISK